MANIRAFRGYRYNGERITNLGSVVSPPYYNLTAEAKEELYGKSEFNSVRLFSGKKLESDTDTENAFTRAGEYLNSWIKDDILVRDEEPVIYMYEQTIEMYGTHYSNTSFVALVELEDDNGSIKPCEKPHEVSMSDRYELLKATNADMSMISCLYVEPEKELFNLMNELREEKPDVEFSSDDNVQQKIWKISYKPTIDFIVERFKNLPLYITDGQTRYETCLKYRDYMKENNPNHTGEELYNYMMMSLSNAHSDGLVVLPVHRAVKAVKKFSESHFIAGAQDHFRVEKIIVDANDDTFLHTMIKQISTVKSETRIAAYCGGNYFYRMVLLDNDYIKNEIHNDMSEEYCKLDVVVLNELILKDVFRIDEEKYGDYVHCTRSFERCYKEVRDGECDIMFVVNPVKVDQIRKITAMGEKLPEMSISVFPKPSVGVIVNMKGNENN